MGARTSHNASSARLYPFRPHSKAFRLGAPRMPAGLLPCRAPRATAEKSCVPTTPCVPAPRHQRRSGWVCDTTLPAGRSLCPASFAGGQRGLRARTVPTPPGWSAGLPAPTTVFGSPRPDAAALPEKSRLYLPTQDKPPQYLLRFGTKVGAQQGLGGESALRITYQYPAYGHGWQSRAVPDRSPRSYLHSALPTTVPVVHSGGCPGGGRILGDYCQVRQAFTFQARSAHLPGSA